MLIFNRHNGPVWKISWCDQKLGSYIASCGFDKSVKIWKEMSPNNWQLDFQVASHEGSVNSVDFSSPELGLKLGCCSSDGSVSIIEKSTVNSQWQVKNYSATTNEPLNSLSWAPFIGTHVEIERNSFCTGSCDNKIRIWNFKEADKSYEVTETILAHLEPVRKVCWNPSPLFSSDVIASCSSVIFLAPCIP
jgi:protein transport protein SEC13